LLGEGSLEKSAMVDVWLEVEAHQLHPVVGAISVECFAAFFGRARNQAVIDENVEKLAGGVRSAAGAAQRFSSAPASDLRPHPRDRSEAAAMAPVEVYGWPESPFVARALLCLEEAGADYQLVPMSRAAGDHLRPEHLARNPFGEVPVLEDRDLTLFVQAGAPARRLPGGVGNGGRVAGGGGPPAPPGGGRHHAAVHHRALVGRVRDQAVVDENVGKLRAVLEVDEARLSRSRYIAGDFVSVADLSHFPLMRYFMATEYAALVEALPHVRAWWEDLAARPGRWPSSCRRILGCPRKMSSDAQCCASYVILYCRSSIDQREAAMASDKAVMKVYGWAVSPFVARALVCLEEAGADYELVPMSKDAGDHRRPDHLARNPFGQVPVLEDGDLTLFGKSSITFSSSDQVSSVTTHNYNS
ncbi:putative glutathione S-transferase GSTF1, partial [Dichanthelium oligosanthes]